MSHFCGPSPNSLISAKEDGKPYLFIYFLIYLFMYLFISGWWILLNKTQISVISSWWVLQLCRLLPAAAPWGDGFQWSDPTVPGVSEWSKNGAAVVPVVGQCGEVWSDWWLKKMGSFSHLGMKTTWHTVDLSEILHHQKDGWNMLKPYNINNGMFTIYQLVQDFATIHSTKSHGLMIPTSTDSVENSELNFSKSPWKTDLAGDPPVSGLFTTYNPMKRLGLRVLLVPPFALS